jgi:hypothetical protein
MKGKSLLAYSVMGSYVKKGRESSLEMAVR